MKLTTLAFAEFSTQILILPNGKLRTTEGKLLAHGHTMTLSPGHLPFCSQLQSSDLDPASPWPGTRALV